MLIYNTLFYINIKIIPVKIGYIKVNTTQIKILYVKGFSGLTIKTTNINVY